MQNMTLPIIRMNISIPEKVVQELDETVPERGKSKFITAAIEEKLERERRDRAMAKLRILPPAFPEIADAAEYIHNLRRADDEQRAKKLGQ